MGLLITATLGSPRPTVLRHRLVIMQQASSPYSRSIPASRAIRLLPTWILHRTTGVLVSDLAVLPTLRLAMVDQPWCRTGVWRRNDNSPPTSFSASVMLERMRRGCAHSWRR